jgi:hypothetical protein
MTGVMDEEEYQKHRVRRGKCDASDHVYGLGDPYRVGRHFALVAAAVVSDVLLLLQRKTVINIRLPKTSRRRIYDQVQPYPLYDEPFFFTQQTYNLILRFSGAAEK